VWLVGGTPPPPPRTPSSAVPAALVPPGSGPGRVLTASLTAGWRCVAGGWSSSNATSAPVRARSQLAASSMAWSTVSVRSLPKRYWVTECRCADSRTVEVTEIPRAIGDLLGYNRRSTRSTIREWGRDQVLPRMLTRTSTRRLCSIALVAKASDPLLLVLAFAQHRLSSGTRSRRAGVQVRQAGGRPAGPLGRGQRRPGGGAELGGRGGRVADVPLP
jgi:hypothetical protein